MKAINSYRSSARVTEEIEDTRAIAQQLANATHGNPEEIAVITGASSTYMARAEQRDVRLASVPHRRHYGLHH